MCYILEYINAIFLLCQKNVWLPLPSVLFGVIAISAGLLSLLLPETLGKQLPESIEEAEHFSTVRSVFNLCIFIYECYERFLFSTENSRH